MKRITWKSLALIGCLLLIGIWGIGAFSKKVPSPQAETQQQTISSSTADGVLSEESDLFAQVKAGDLTAFSGNWNSSIGAEMNFIDGEVHLTNPAKLLLTYKLAFDEGREESDILRVPLLSQNDSPDAYILFEQTGETLVVGYDREAEITFTRSE